MTDLGIQEFDPAACLTSAERIAAYIQAVAEETDDDVRAIIRAFAVAVRARGGPLTVAADAGMTVEDLRAALADDGDPSFDTILKVARAVGVTVSFGVAR
ncbi:addiction module antidote protein [Brevundimonas diminuta]|uniref:addiction module antidote protein n=1 Tax=Brevundimonas diminuta TaxID=293 RepID=UPI0030FC7DFE